MPVSPRLRFEILKRDNYTCRYCRSKDNELTVDHVIPQALGGADKPENLVAACKNCNSGKTSTNLSDPTVAQVTDAAIARGKRFREILSAEAASLKAARDAAASFRDGWDVLAEERGLAWAAPADDAERTLMRWFRMGIPTEIVQDAMETALDNPKIPQRSKYVYFCGIMRNKIEKFIELSDTGEVQDACGHCEGCLINETCDLWGYELEPDEDPYKCDICGSPHCLYSLGIQSGMVYESQRHFSKEHSDGA
ncbi:HNH endonuclease [Timonella senegalensis]|uniref:HNH endonuclease n=1 Tax=Timonella senegalensis TaxID=1465825 RepID=UPI002FDDD362